MKVYSGIEEFQGAVGTHLGDSPWHRVTQEQIDLFAEATGDHQWIHVDVARAKEGPFGTTIAHGYLTLSLVPILAGQVYSVENLRMRVNYGSNLVRFPAPVAPVFVEEITEGDQLVQLGQRCDLRHRHQVTAAEPANLTLDPALLVRAFLAGDAEEPIETVFSELPEHPEPPRF